MLKGFTIICNPGDSNRPRPLTKRIIEESSFRNHTIVLSPCQILEEVKDVKYLRPSRHSHIYDFDRTETFANFVLDTVGDSRSSDLVILPPQSLSMGSDYLGTDKSRAYSILRTKKYYQSIEEILSTFVFRLVNGLAWIDSPSRVLFVLPTPRYTKRDDQTSFSTDSATVWDCYQKCLGVTNNLRSVNPNFMQRMSFQVVFIDDVYSVCTSSRGRLESEFGLMNRFAPQLDALFSAAEFYRATSTSKPRTRMRWCIPAEGSKFYPVHASDLCEFLFETSRTKGSFVGRLSEPPQVPAQILSQLLGQKPFNGWSENLNLVFSVSNDRVRSIKIGFPEDSSSALKPLEFSPQHRVEDFVEEFKKHLEALQSEQKKDPEKKAGVVPKYSAWNPSHDFPINYI